MALDLLLLIHFHFFQFACFQQLPMANWLNFFTFERSTVLECSPKFNFSFALHEFRQSSLPKFSTFWFESDYFLLFFQTLIFVACIW